MSNEATVVDAPETSKGHPVAIVVTMLVVWIALTFLAERIGGGVSSWHAPSQEDFEFSGWFGTTWFNKPMLLAIIGFVGVLAYWLIASRRLKVIP